VARPAWYGFPDVCADGLPVWHPTHLPRRGRAAEPFLADPPPWAGPAVFVEKPHSAMCGLTCDRTDGFGRRGQIFVAEWGTLAPLNSPDQTDLDHGFGSCASTRPTDQVRYSSATPRPGRRQPRAPSGSSDP